VTGRHSAGRTPLIPALSPGEREKEFWLSLRKVTQARIGLARTGASLGTGALLELRMAHALARDAVHAGLDEGALVAGLPSAPVVVASGAADRRTYLLRPDLGRRLGEGAAAALGAHAGVFDLVVVLGDGLSALALQRHAGPLLSALLPALVGWRVAPLVLVQGARVAVGDAVAAAIGMGSDKPGAVLVLLGERPGLSAPDSLGAYATWRPGVGTTDAERNCVSNIRPEGLGYAEAAHRLWHLLEGMRQAGLSGVGLKDDSEGVGVLARA
jgi:ethanolamine ammonia-lyase small subunit